VVVAITGRPELEHRPSQIIRLLNAHNARYELFRGSVRQDDWKLVWQTVLPSRVELFDLRADPYEQKNVASEHEETVRALQKKVDGYASQMSKSLLLQQLFKAVNTNATGKPPAFPNEDEFFEQGD
jgi:hypothetical protein